MIHIQHILRHSDCVVNVGTKQEGKGSKDLESPYGATISSRIMSTDLCNCYIYCVYLKMILKYIYIYKETAQAENFGFASITSFYIRDAAQYQA